jgi:hypothetical protein
MARRLALLLLLLPLLLLLHALHVPQQRGLKLLRRKIAPAAYAEAQPAQFGVGGGDAPVRLALLAAVDHARGCEEFMSGVGRVVVGKATGREASCLSKEKNFHGQ